MIKEIEFKDGKTLTFKKLAYLMADIETDRDRDIFFLQYVASAFQNGKITWTDHEYFYSMYDKLKVKEA